MDQECLAILAKPCPYTVAPFQIPGGHSFCTCVLEALRASYVGGYRAAKAGEAPEVGIETVDAVKEP